MKLNYDPQTAYINREVEVLIWDIPTKVHIYAYIPELDDIQYVIKDSPLAIKLVEESGDLVDELERDLKVYAEQYIERTRNEYLEEKAREQADDRRMV